MERTRVLQDTFERDVLKRIARAINDEYIRLWAYNGQEWLVKSLHNHRIYWLPLTLTAEAISWWRDKKQLLVPALKLYSPQERQDNLSIAKKNAPHQAIINEAWVSLWGCDGTDMKLMLTAWAKRSRYEFKDYELLGKPICTKAEEFIRLDCDFDENRARVKEIILFAKDSTSGRLLFEI